MGAKQFTALDEPAGTPPAGRVGSGRWWSGRRGLAVLATAALAGAAGLVGVGHPVAAAPAAPAVPGDLVSKTTRAVTVAGVLGHLRKFQSIADANNGSRASGTPGYDKSADYVAARLKAAGYKVTRQTFQFPYFKELSPGKFSQVSPVPTTYTGGTDFAVFAFSGDGAAQGTVQAVDVNLTPPRASTSGCETADFAGFTAGNIALIQRGTCEFGVKVSNAAAAGASAVIIFNQGNGTPEENPDRFAFFEGTLSAPGKIPAISVPYALGEKLVGTENLVVRVETDTVSETRTTQNVLAETPTGRADNVVMAGAHLDSVPEGPGINDNGTGSAALLEVAIRTGPSVAKVKPKNKLRFAWWGAEEAGLLGSEYYVGNLTPQQIKDIALYLNFDMVGSPNYFLGVYDGDDSAGTGSGPGPAGSARIEQVFRAFFASRGQQASDTDFTGRSDYGPFIAEGIDIPAGGLFTGAEGTKTAEDAAKYGGVPGVAYDPCYHQPCDSFTPVDDKADKAVYDQLKKAYGARLLGNLNVFALDLNADAIATAVVTFAFDTSGVTDPAPAPTASTGPAGPASPGGGGHHGVGDAPTA